MKKEVIKIANENSKKREEVAEIIYNKFIPKKVKREIDDYITNIWGNQISGDFYATELLMRDWTKLEWIADRYKKCQGQGKREKIKIGGCYENERTRNCSRWKNLCAKGFYIGEFKGHPVITFKRDEDDKFPLTFGLGKARLIMANMDALKAFVEGNKDKAGKRGVS